MKSTIGQAIRFIISLGIALAIFWFLYKDFNLNDLKTYFKELSVFWVFVSIFISLLGYVMRALRWRLLLETSETHSDIGFFRVFWGLMFGYVVNLVLPRAGELSRCVYLRDTTGYPVSSALGSVITERVIDLICLIVITLLALIFQFGVFTDLFEELVLSGFELSFVYFIVGALLIALVGLWGAIAFFKRLSDTNRFKVKVLDFWKGLKEGLSGIFKLRKKRTFLMYSVLIWLFYFLMMWTISKAATDTAALSPAAILVVLVMGSIGMIAPVQGGIGTFHALIAFILSVYGIEESQGKIFAIITHSSQVLTVMVLGLGSLIYLARKRNKNRVVESTTKS